MGGRCAPTPRKWHQIAPDGRGLPPGSGTPAESALVYAQKCQACRGEKGVGGPNDRLVGGLGTLASKTPRTVGSYWLYATTVFDYVRRSMPLAQPHSLTQRGLRGHRVSAQSQRHHRRAGRDERLDLPRVNMPNRDNFILVHPWKPKTP
jgi:S-disulfanyl-L-cysteine oxidoreductase SoxD